MVQSRRLRKAAKLINRCRSKQTAAVPREISSKSRERWGTFNFEGRHPQIECPVGFWRHASPTLPSETKFIKFHSTLGLPIANYLRSCEVFLIISEKQRNYGCLKHARSFCAILYHRMSRLSGVGYGTSCDGGGDETSAGCDLQTSWNVIHVMILVL